MKPAAGTVTVHILDKEYQVACPPEERDALLRASRELDTRMRTIRSSSNLIGLERIAVMAALNLSHDLLESRVATQSTPEIQRLNDKLDSALSRLTNDKLI